MADSKVEVNVENTTGTKYRLVSHTRFAQTVLKPLQHTSIGGQGTGGWNLRLYPDGSLTHWKDTKKVAARKEREAIEEEAAYLAGMDVEDYRSAMASWRAGQKQDPCLDPSSYLPQPKAVEVAQEEREKGRPKPKPRRRRGLGGITSKNRRDVGGAMHLLDAKYGIHRLSFITTTMSDGMYKRMRSQGVNWCDIQERFMSLLSKRFKRDGHEFVYAYANEIQPERWFNRGQCCAHTHMCLLGKGAKGSWWYRFEDYKSIWTEATNQILGEATEPGGLDLQPIKVSIAAYLSSYLKKAGVNIDTVLKSEPECMIPTNWVGMSKALKKEILERVQDLNPDHPLCRLMVFGGGLGFFSTWLEIFVTCEKGQQILLERAYLPVKTTREYLRKGIDWLGRQFMKHVKEAAKVAGIALSGPQWGSVGVS